MSIHCTKRSTIKQMVNVTRTSESRYTILSYYMWSFLCSISLHTDSRTGLICHPSAFKTSFVSSETVSVHRAIMSFSVPLSLRDFPSTLAPAMLPRHPWFFHSVVHPSLADHLVLQGVVTAAYSIRPTLKEDYYEDYFRLHY